MLWPSVSGAAVLGTVFTFMTLCLNADASALPYAPHLEERAAAVCTRGDIVIINKVFTKYSSIAKQVCTKVLNLTPPGTVTTTITKTTTIGTLLTGNTVVTVTAGTSTVVAQTTTTRDSTVTATAFATAATTISVPTTVTTLVSTVTSVVTNPQSTTTVTVQSAAPVYKRGASRIGDIYPGCPNELASIALSLASQACSCFITQAPASTATVTATSTVLTTTNGVVTSTVTVPAATTTTTSTSTEVRFSTVTTTSTVTEGTTVTAPVTALTTTTTTATSTPPPATVTVPVVRTYSSVSLPRNDCTYNRYFDFPSVSNDPGPQGNYAPGVRQCQDLCTSNTSCQFFMFIKFDPVKARGFDGAACILDNLPYDASFLQCQYVTNFNVAYNKNP